MFSLFLTGDRNEDDEIVLEYLKASLSEERDVISFYSDLSNASALLKWYIPRINWLGFYIRKGDTLFLGPFQGEPACTTIPFSKGVCGKCAREKRTIVVDDVSLFPGHIACSGASRSEVVLPLLDKEREVWGVLDIDSPETARFTKEDTIFLEKAATILSSLLNESVKWY